jgi:hypothetical protein
MPSQRLTLWKNFSTHSRAMRAIQTFRLHFLKPPTALVPSVLLEGSLVAADLHATIQAATDVAGLTGITLPVARTNTPGMAQFG